MQTLLKIAALTSLCLLSLSACNHTAPVQVNYTPVAKPTLVLPKASTLKMNPVHWKVVTADNIDSILASMKSAQEPPVLFALTTKGYENLSVNMNNLKSYVQQKNAIIVAYQNYYTSSNKAIDEANVQLAKKPK